MKIIVDAMGGDHAPDAVVKGVALAVSEYGAEITLVGNEEIIKKLLDECAADEIKEKITIVHTDESISMEDDPTCVVRSKKNSSMAVGLQMVKEQGDAFVSAGNTGALHTGASLIVRKINGIQRPAIATILPFERPVLLMDAGANPVVTVDYLEQWASMGSLYMNKIYGVETPEVGLLNNGTEEHKGTPLMAEAHQRLKKSDVCFIGNVESSSIPSSPCDVLITDGFTGNITLKLVEGMGKFMMKTLKKLFTHDLKTKIAFLAVKSPLMEIRKNLDASEHGGAPLLGVKKPVIKAHGSSDALAIKNAIRQAMAFVESDLIGEITNAAAEYASRKKEKDDAQ